jgi:tRNA U34 5-carboxymethylaminomethyl modifying GTPase MnmE/TrmE
MCCILTDTAGLRSNTDIDSGLYPVGHVELEGMRRARDAIRDSDLKIFMCDVADNASVLSMKNMIQRDIDQGSNAFKNNIIVVHNKVDELVNYQHFLNKDNHTFDGGKILCAPVSCKKGTGLENLEALIRDKISECLQIDTKGAAVQDKIHGITRQRHRFHVEQCIHHLKIFLNENDAYEFQLPIDAKAEELRLVSILLPNLFCE